MRFIDDKSKELTWWNRNYFYLTTIIYIAINIIFFVIFPSNSFESERSGFYYFFDSFTFYLKEAYIHSSWNHVLHNMLCFAIPAFYLERKNGTISFGLLTLLISVISAMCKTGQSFIWAFMMGYMLIDYLFSFKKEKRNKTNIIVGAVVLFLIYFRCCFYDTASGGISITWYPFQLIHNAVHAEGYFLGLITSVVIQISQLFIILQSDKKEVKKNKMNKIEKVIYIISACLILALVGATIGTSILATNRDSYTINFVSEYPEFNKTYTTTQSLYQVEGQWINEFDLSENYKIQFFANSQKTKNIDLSTHGSYINFQHYGFCKLSMPNEVTIYVELTERS